MLRKVSCPVSQFRQWITTPLFSVLRHICRYASTKPLHKCGCCSIQFLKAYPSISLIKLNAAMPTQGGNKARSVIKLCLQTPHSHSRTKHNSPSPSDPGKPDMMLSKMTRLASWIRRQFKESEVVEFHVTTFLWRISSNSSCTFEMESVDVNESASYKWIKDEW